MCRTDRALLAHWFALIVPMSPPLPTSTRRLVQKQYEVDAG